MTRNENKGCIVKVESVVQNVSFSTCICLTEEFSTLQHRKWQPGSQCGTGLQAPLAMLASKIGILVGIPAAAIPIWFHGDVLGKAAKDVGVFGSLASHVGDSQICVKC